MAIQIIQSLHYAEIGRVIQFNKVTSTQVELSVTAWSEVPMHPASGEMNTMSNQAEPGLSFSHNISARLKNQYAIPDAVILKITLCNDTELIIGTPDIPVRFNRNTNLFLSTLSISHQSLTPALILTS